MNNPDHEIKTLALVMTIARQESDFDYRLLRFALIALGLASFLLAGWDTASIVAGTLATTEFAACVRLMISLNMLKRAYDNHISRV